MTIIVAKMIPDNVDISTILSNPTPTTPSAYDEPSANRPINGYTIIAKIKQIMKLWTASPSGFLNGSTKPEWSPDDNLAPKILIRLPLSPENSGNSVSRLGLVSKVSTALFNMLPAAPPKKEHNNKTGVDCLKIMLVSSDNLKQ